MCISWYDMTLSCSVPPTSTWCHSGGSYELTAPVYNFLPNKTLCSVYIIFRVLGYAMEMCIHQQFATRFCDQSLQEVRLSHIILWCILRMYIQITLLYIFTVLRLLLSRQLVSFQDRVFITNLQVMADSCIYSNKVCKFYLCVFFWSVNAQCVPCYAFLSICNVCVHPHFC